jgi:hypothetical protein
MCECTGLFPIRVLLNTASLSLEQNWEHLQSGREVVMTTERLRIGGACWVLSVIGLIATVIAQTGWLGSGAGELHALPFDTAGPVDHSHGRVCPFEVRVEGHADGTSPAGADLAAAGVRL